MPAIDRCISMSNISLDQLKAMRSRELLRLGDMPWTEDETGKLAAMQPDFTCVQILDKLIKEMEDASRL